MGHGEALIHAEEIASKTAVSAEAGTRFLPYVALGTGVVGTNWGSPWLSARLADGLDFSDHALPSFSERTLAWTSNPMSASEATYWLREFLEGALEPGLALKFGSHSCDPLRIFPTAARMNAEKDLPQNALHRGW